MTHRELSLEMTSGLSESSQYTSSAQILITTANMVFWIGFTEWSATNAKNAKIVEIAICLLNWLFSFLSDCYDNMRKIKLRRNKRRELDRRAACRAARDGGTAAGVGSWIVVCLYELIVVVFVRMIASGVEWMVQEVQNITMNSL